MMIAKQLSFADAVANRRTMYQLKPSSTVSDERIANVIKDAIRYTPSAFDSRSTRLVVLLKHEHEQFWDIVTGILKQHVPESKWEHTGPKMAMFRQSYGSILFYEAQGPVKATQSQYSSYADKFPQWSEHTSAMHQYVIWTALEAEGLGCNLQHYNPLADRQVSEVFGIPTEWTQKAQLVFGEPEVGAREHLLEKLEPSMDESVKIFGI